MSVKGFQVEMIYILFTYIGGLNHKHIMKKIMKPKYFLIFIFLTLSISVYSQGNQDSLTLARNLIAKNSLDVAEEVLQSYLMYHENDLEPNWLLALVLSYQNRSDESISVFKKCLAISPGNKQVMLDLARVYFKQGELSNTIELAKKLKDDSLFAYEALKMEAFSYYWLENYSRSLALISELKKISTTDKSIDELLDLIRQARMLNISVNTWYSSDNQPLNVFGQEISAYKKISYLLSPKIEFKNMTYSPGYSAKSIALGNEVSVVKFGLTIGGSFGVFRNQNYDYETIGNLQIGKKITKFSTLKLGFNRLPYMGTVASTKMSLMQKNYFANYLFVNDKLLTFSVLYNNQVFPDENEISTLGLWFITRELKIVDFALMFGYGFSYSDAQENTFTPENSLEQILADETLQSSITGIYVPYFTPERQFVNSGIGVLKYRPSKKFELSATFNLGLLASHRNPYFYLDSNAQNSIFIMKKYAKTEFLPMEIKSYFAYTPTKRLNFRAYYNFQSTYYYSINNIGLAVNFKF